MSVHRSCCPAGTASVGHMGRGLATSLALVLFACNTKSMPSPGACNGTSPNGTCLPPVLHCPGPAICVECSPGLYFQEISDCTCTSGTWTCGPEDAGTNGCPDPTIDAVYTDPACSILHGGPIPDGGA